MKWSGTASLERTTQRLIHSLRERGRRAPEWLVKEAWKRMRRAGTWCRAWLLRRHLAKQVTYVGITGTAGKTTAKDLSFSILSAFAPCRRSNRSSNEPFYVAQTIASVGRQHRFCVVEVAAAEKHDLALPAWLLKPDIAVLTLVAREHYSRFRSLEAIAAEKRKLIAALQPDGVAVLNIDDPLVRAIGERCNRRVIWVGKGQGATLRLLDARSRYPEPLRLKVEHREEIFEVNTQLHGEHLAVPVLAALGVALAAGLPLDKAIAALAQIQPTEGRMQIVTTDDGVTFVRDDWKAPHWSIKPPFEFLKVAQAKRKVAIIGSVSDSPKGPRKRYARLAQLALEVADLVVFVGSDSLYALKAKPASAEKSLLAFPELQDAAEYLRTELRAGDLVLLKGTNTQDHLVRILLSRTSAIQCWRSDCRLSRFCGRCSRLYEPVGHRQPPGHGAINDLVHS
jgi:UDP-N-acetylmuramoyl-tripeptide--D-alanyl-D-alanine ligase